VYTVNDRQVERREGTVTDTEERPAPVHRPKLSTSRVIAAAVAIADRAGISALSMRRLADDLDVVPMALYRHVTNKDDLLDRIVDVVFAEVELDSGAHWRLALRDRALSKRAALLRHPWAIGQMESRAPGPANLRHHDEMVRCLRGPAGLSLPAALHVYSLMDSYIYGFSFQQSSLTATSAPATAPTNGAAPGAVRGVTGRPLTIGDDHPHLGELVAEIGRTGYDFDEEFAFGLDLLLDGIDRLRAAQGGSTPA
jgi:AcrR family transcriptional regulator